MSLKIPEPFFTSVLIFVIIFINVGHVGPPDNPSFLSQPALILKLFLSWTKRYTHKVTWRGRCMASKKRCKRPFTLPSLSWHRSVSDHSNTWKQSHSSIFKLLKLLGSLLLWEFCEWKRYRLLWNVSKLI